MDSFELNKILGALLATCLAVLSLNIAAGAVFTPSKIEKPGYAIVVPDVPAAGEAAKPEPAEPIAVRLASSDPKKGETAAKQCAACHTFEKGGPNRVGPNLFGIVDRAKASVAGFNYSAALKAKGGSWTFDDLDHFLDQPESVAAGHQYELCRPWPRWAARRSDQFPAYTVGQPGAAAQGGGSGSSRTGRGEEIDSKILGSVWRPGPKARPLPFWAKVGRFGEMEYGKLRAINVSGLGFSVKSS